MSISINMDGVTRGNEVITFNLILKFYHFRCCNIQLFYTTNKNENVEESDF